MNSTSKKSHPLLAVLICTTILALGVLQQRTGAQTPNKTVDADSRLKQLQWMVGDWQSTRDGETLEESWREAKGDSMVGTFRWLRGGKVWLYELLTISAENDEVVFRLRHFDEKMVAWEDKDGAYTLNLVKQSAKEAVFESTDPKNPLRFTYRREKSDGLFMSITSTDKEKSGAKVFHFTLAANE